MEEDEENAEFFDAIAEHPEGFTLSVSKSRESLQSSSSEQSIGMDGENAKPLLARTLSDTTGQASVEIKQEVSKDSVAGTSETSTAKDTEGSDVVSDGRSSSTDPDNKAVMAPFTVGGSFAVTVSLCFILFPLISVSY